MTERRRTPSPGSSRSSWPSRGAGLHECVTCKDNCFPQLLLLVEFAHNAADKIYRAIVAGEAGEKRLKPDPAALRHQSARRATSTSTPPAPSMPTDPDKCHVSHVVCDTESWEQKMAQTLEDMPEVVRYVKNQNLGFCIPYTFNGDEHRYIPDFIVRVRPRSMPDSEPLQPHHRGLRPGQEGEGRQGRDRSLALWVPAVQQPRRFWPLGLPRDQRPVGREEHDSSVRREQDLLLDV